MAGARAKKTGAAKPKVTGPASVESPPSVEAGPALPPSYLREGSPGRLLAAYLESGSEGIQSFRADILDKLASAVLTVAESSCLKGALTGLRDFERHISERETPVLVAAAMARLDALEAAQSGVHGFAQRSSSAITPPDPAGKATH